MKSTLEKRESENHKVGMILTTFFISLYYVLRSWKVYESELANADVIDLIFIPSWFFLALPISIYFIVKKKGKKE